MSSPKQLSTFLPYTFANGTTIRRVAKGCPRCAYVLTPERMRGLVFGDEDNLYIAAHAKCPHCHCTFSVCCVVNDTKQIVKVPLPISIMKWWIRRALRKQANEVLKNKIVISLPNEEEDIPLPPKSLTLEDLDFCGEILGYLGTLPIPDYIHYQNKHYDFSRVCQQLDGLILSEEEQLFREQLIYTFQTSTEQKHN